MPITFVGLFTILLGLQTLHCLPTNRGKSDGDSNDIDDKTIATVKLMKNILQSLNMKAAPELSKEQKQVTERTREELKKRLGVDDAELDRRYETGNILGKSPKPVSARSLITSARDEFQMNEVYYLHPEPMSEKVQWHATKRVMKNAINIQVSLRDLLNENNLVHRLTKVKFELPIRKVKAPHILQNGACVLAFRIDENNRVNIKNNLFASGRYSHNKKRVAFEGVTSLMEMLISDLWKENVENLRLSIIVSAKKAHCHDRRHLKPYHFTIPSLRLNTALRVSLKPETEEDRTHRQVNITIPEQGRLRVRRETEGGCDPYRHCCVSRFVLNFTEIGWDYIVAPRRIHADTCQGECTVENVAIKRPSEVKMLRTVNMCCVPTRMEPMTILYMTTSENLAIKHVADVKTSRCGCR
ncbi:DgyrCDS6348 [Dimorphilus gyrociliatus]|uniref:DgyrCDS6348 n=1 Tax=Dimorphilus gyrociliatus TaxID=2664684 RepID=A0A7I8VMT6_9ANNE|nr:DgyrCDS6348 [Dimorphilus gyrociliatus]